METQKEMNAESLVKSASKEIESYGMKPVVNAELCAVATLDLIGMIQLCTRHPALPERQIAFAKDMVANLSKAFKPEHKAIAELIRRGWQQEYDRELSA